MKLFVRYLSVLILGLMALSFSPAEKPRGLFTLYRWIGRHGYYSQIHLTSDRYKFVSWANNFFDPTKVEIVGKVKIESDSVILIPEKIKFNRPQTSKSRSPFKRVACKCDEKGLSKIDRQEEWYVFRYCDKKKYFFNVDTLTEAKTNSKFIRK